MLKEFSVNRLYGLYDYSIVLTEYPIMPHYITGPNGSGKTTLLKAINALYHLDFNYFLGLPFDTFHFVFDKYVLNLNRTVKEKKTKKGSDAIEKPIVELECMLFSNANELIESSLWILNNGKAIKKTGNINTMQLFFATDTCFFISDQRMNSNQNHNDAKVDNNFLINVLLNIEQTFSQYIISNDTIVQFISEDDFLKRKNEIKTQLKQLWKYGILTIVDDQHLEYNPLGITLLAKLERAFSAIQEQIKIVSFFSDFLENSCFLNKTFRINKSYGLRIYATDPDRTILSIDQLSSGEKHLICQMFSMLFIAPKSSITLVDEPEISLHMSWQMQYQYNMSKVIELRGHQVVVATHSPQIFDAKFEYTTDLFESLKSQT